jgi:hypothetical protein
MARIIVKIVTTKPSAIASIAVANCCNPKRNVKTGMRAAMIATMNGMRLVSIAGRLSTEIVATLRKTGKITANLATLTYIAIAVIARMKFAMTTQFA